MCDCGCNTCETKSTLMLNESLAPRDILSEGLKHHLDANKPLTEHLYRAGSDNYFNLWAEARSLYSRNILEITNEDDLAVLTETDLGHFGMFEGKKVPLDFPMLDEEVNSGDLNNAVYRLENVYKYLDIEYKETRRGEKYVQINYIPVTSPQSQNPEFVNVRYNNDEDLEIIKNRLDLPMLNEVTRYSGFNKNPEDPDSVPFNPTGAVAEFREELRALFGKFKGDLKNPEFIKGVAQIMVNWKALLRSQLDEKKKAKKNTKKLNKPMRDSSGGKAYKVYVKDPKTGNIKTVRFGSGGLRAKINDPKARQAFAKRHKCSTRNDKTKASYWSCRLPRYAKLLGLKSNFGGFW